jgi:predicted transcriptional regulator
MIDLGPLEMQVLGLLDGAEPQSVADLRARVGKKLAYTTVMTVLARLHKKGLVVRVKDGPRFLYSAGARAPKVKGGIMSRVRQALFPDAGGSRERPLLALLEEEPLTQGELRELREAIDRRLANASAKTKAK